MTDQRCIAVAIARRAHCSSDCYDYDTLLTKSENEYTPYEKAVSFTILDLEALAKLQISNKYESITALKQLLNQTTEHLNHRGGASNQAQRIIGQIFFFRSDINFIRQFFYQTEFKPISKHQFETSEMMRILNSYIHTYHLRFIPEGVAEVSQFFFRYRYPHFTKIS
jgi:hypothetical protein